MEHFSIDKIILTIVVMLIFVAISFVAEKYKENEIDGVEIGVLSFLAFAIIIVIAMIWMMYDARARDLDGRYAGSPLKEWFDSLKSGKGPCCSDADGTAISDVDWQTRGGHYRVRINGAWIDVPDDAVITEPNRAGRAMVWPIQGYEGLTIRCFMPGSMT